MLESSSLEFKSSDSVGVKQLYYKVWEVRLEQVWNQLERAGFKPILIKGWAAAQNYPNPYDRQYVDIDLMFDAREFKEVSEYIKVQPLGVSVDLHCGPRHLDELSFTDLYKNSILKKCGQTQIRVPCDEDHLRILCVHWLNDGGADSQRLEDIYFAVKHRAPHFDWEKSLDMVSAKRRQWVVCAIVLAHRYLDLNIDEIPLSVQDKELPKWLVAAVEREWDSGVRLIPLQAVLNQKARLWEQLQKRFLPNPIQATIETGGAFDNKPRIIYQLADILKRAYPSLKRISQTFWQQRKNK